MNISKFLNWVEIVDNFFDYMEVPKDKQVKMVAYKLRGGASIWWLNTFLSSNYQKTLFKQYHHCQQSLSTVVEYVDKFQEYRVCNNSNESESS